ncbi:MAG: hypothetical protein HOW73_11000 [Polyangiaceae bacterium]|nr:hypothetical protein [Polyangiaceae bacterium]
MDAIEASRIGRRARAEANSHDDLAQTAAKQLATLREGLLDAEHRHAALIDERGEESALSVRNFVHYLALRRSDVRPLQVDLARLGLSSLGRSESHVLSNIDAILRAIDALTHTDRTLSPSAGAPSLDEGERLLEAHTLALLGARPARRATHVMVTMPGSAAADEGLIRRLLEVGMDAARINCAHDDADAWEKMAGTLRRLSAERGRPCRIQMDLGGPKVRTGPCAPEIVLHAGDPFVLTTEKSLGVPARFEAGGVVVAAEVPCVPARALDDVRVGERVLLDDGKLSGVVEAIGPAGATVRVTQAKAKGMRVRADLGINLPDTDLALDALTSSDRDDLKTVARLADIVGLSFAQRPGDVADIESELRGLGDGKTKLGLVLKIETRRGFSELPNLLLAALGTRPLGVMIARGDMAVECGYERLAEIQEEMLWLCEAAHVPVIWATQVLDRLARKGLPTRAEITDAAMSGRAECVMLNKGPFVVEAVELLDHILLRMERHQHKKTATMRPLSVSRALD